MKFSVATSAILSTRSMATADTMPLAAAKDVKQPVLSGTGLWTLQQQKHKNQDRLQQSRKLFSGKQALSPLSRQLESEWAAAGGDGRRLLKNTTIGNGNKKFLRECAPQQTTNAADVGLLSCGLGQYCLESSDSSMGGYCVSSKTTTPTQLPGRRRQQVVGRLSIIELADLWCNRPQETGMTVDCNCTGMDFATMTGELSCTFGPDCEDIGSGCADDEPFSICLSEELTATLEAVDSYTYTSCYTQTLPLSNERFSYCTEFGYSVADGPTCDMKVEGVACNYCNIDVGGGDQYGENCEVFDCSNTISQYKGDRCGAFSAPTLRNVALLEYMYAEKWPCVPDGCNLCGEGGRMTKGLNNFTYPQQLLDENVTIECYDLQYDALIGGLVEGDYCAKIAPLVEELCGCVAGSSTDAPAGVTSSPAGAPSVASPTLDPAPASPTVEPMLSGGDPSPVLNRVVALAGILTVTAFAWIW